ncbi:DUF7542 family protein [Salinigranum marinum]|uniref:DUF7542 family protein n=1 Tax=Salinigranum marinum TaxID=1515595 RepID=UPI00298A0174|nr:hypothetical protein [Salinigranum marinum]
MCPKRRPSRSNRARAPFVVSCPDCERSHAVDRPNEAVAFFRRHERLTGHAVEWERPALDVEGLRAAPTDRSLDAVISWLDEQYDDGVPLGVVTAVRSDQGVSMHETFEAIEARRLSGALYEPRDDHLQPV